MRVRSKRSKVLFRDRRVPSVQQSLSSSNVKARESSSLGKMTAVENAISTSLEEPVESITPDSLQQLSNRAETTNSSGIDDFPVPELFTSLPPIKDPLVTDTSLSQDETAENCLPCHAGTTEFGLDRNPQGIPRLNREDHVGFLSDNIQNARYIAYDALRPWIIYWSLTGLSVLGEDLTQWRDRVLETCTSMQNPTGGFGGGHGQTSHAAPSYAAVLSLAMVGGREALDLIDRRAL